MTSTPFILVALTPLVASANSLSPGEVAAKVGGGSKGLDLLLLEEAA